MRGILIAPAGLLLEPRHLRQQQRALELRHAQIEPARGVTELIGAYVLSRPAVVVERVALLQQVGVVGQNGAALAGIQVLAGLKAEAAGLAQRAQLFAL